VSVPALTFVTYLWHYVLARALYDHLGLAALAIALAILVFTRRRR